MWQLYQTAKATATRPSDLLTVEDRWAALQLDNAVTLLGNAIENAAQERHDVGTRWQPNWQPKYTIQQLLDPAFRLPSPAKQEQDAVSALKALARKGKGVKVFKAKG